MQIHQVKQGSTEWLALRAAIPTASEFSKLVTPKKREIAKGKDYLYEKLAERWLGRPLDAFSGSWAMNQGSILEDEAIPTFQLNIEEQVQRVGFITTDDGRIGCSPDGWMGNSGLECKCPAPETHVEYLIGGVCPDKYLGQVQGSMLITGVDHWYFVSYARRFPMLTVRVERDEEYLKVLTQAIDLFTTELDRAYAKLIELNGNPPNHADFALNDWIEAEPKIGE